MLEWCLVEKASLDFVFLKQLTILQIDKKMPAPFLSIIKIDKIRNTSIGTLRIDPNIICLKIWAESYPSIRSKNLSFLSVCYKRDNYILSLARGASIVWC